MNSLFVSLKKPLTAGAVPGEHKTLRGSEQKKRVIYREKGHLQHLCVPGTGTGKYWKTGWGRQMCSRDPVFLCLVFSCSYKPRRVSR